MTCLFLAADNASISAELAALTILLATSYSSSNITYKQDSPNAQYDGEHRRGYSTTLCST